jgi:predicted nucleotidyltransferase
MFTANQLGILAVLVTRPDSEYHMSELGRILGKPAGVFQKGLNSLQRQGYVLSRMRGNQRLFSINREHPLFNEISSIVQKTGGVEAMLRSLVARIPGVETALIYGSYTQNRMRPDSDIDLLVVCKSGTAEDDLVKKLDAVEHRLQREVNYKSYSVRQFRSQRTAHDPFLDTVLGGKYILLKGQV